MTKVKRLGFARKCFSLQLVWLQIGTVLTDCNNWDCVVKKVPGQMIYLIKWEKLNLQTNKKGETSELVNHHILGYNPIISHYRRSHTPNRLYISPEHNTSAIFKDVLHILLQESKKNEYQLCKAWRRGVWKMWLSR